MRHYNEREGAFAVWYGYVAINSLTVSSLVSDVFNFCELVVLKIGLGATDLGDLSVADKVVSPGVSWSCVRDNQRITIARSAGYADLISVRNKRL